MRKMYTLYSWMYTGIQQPACLSADLTNFDLGHNHLVGEGGGNHFRGERGEVTTLGRVECNGIVQKKKIDTIIPI